MALTGLRYGSEEAVAQSRDWLRHISEAAYWASIDLAKEKGAFLLFEAEGYLASGTMRAMPEAIREAVRAQGIRNALLTSIAPTGTISLLAGNVSSGIEPIFALSYRRKVLLPDGSRAEEEVLDHAVALWRRLKGDAPLPESFVTAQELAPSDHLAMQAAAQAHVDSSISKTINVPEAISFAAFGDVYAQAYDMGCKGCTTYRPNDVTGSVLSANSEAKPAPGVAEAAAEPSKLLDRPAALEGATYKLKWPDSEHALYITVNDVEVAGQRRPFEVFINSKNMEHFAWTVALTRMISAVFRRGGDVSFVVEELKAVFDPRGGAWIEGRYVPSMLAAIGGVIEKHMVAIGFLAREGAGLKVDPIAPGLSVERPKGPACPSCGRYGLVRAEGCLSCLDCGYSKCG